MFVIYSEDFDFYSSCFFNKVNILSLYEFSSSQVKTILSRFKAIGDLNIHFSSVSGLDLSTLKSLSFRFINTAFEGEIKLPQYLTFLNICDCKNLSSLKINTVTQIDVYQPNPIDSLGLINKVKGVKYISISTPFSELIKHLPKTVKILGRGIEFDSTNIDCSGLNKKFPFLIKINRKAPIEAAQTLNLRSIHPQMNETEEKFTLRPREIMIDEENVQQLNKHQELFERVEKVEVRTEKFDFKCLSGGMKQIRFCKFSIEGEKLESLEKNNWKFEDCVVNAVSAGEINGRKILNSLRKVKKIIALEKLKEEYPQFKFKEY